MELEISRNTKHGLFELCRKHRKETGGRIKGDKFINQIPGSPSLYEIHNVALCGTVYLHRVQSI